MSANLRNRSNGFLSVNFSVTKNNSAEDYANIFSSTATLSEKHTLPLISSSWRFASISCAPSGSPTRILWYESATAISGPIFSEKKISLRTDGTNYYRQSINSGASRARKQPRNLAISPTPYTILGAWDGDP